MAGPDEKKATKELGEDLEEIKAKLGEQTAMVEIMRRPPGKAEYYNLTRKSIKTFDPDEIAHVYGGGDYKYSVRGPDGKFLSHYERAYDPELKPAAAAPAKDATGAAPDPNLAVITLMMQESRAQADRQMQMMTSLISNMGQRPAGPGLTELVQSIAALDQLRGGGKSDGGMDTIKFATDLMFKIKERVSDDGGEPEGRLMLKVIDTIGELMKGMQKPQLVAIPPAAVASPVTAAAPAPAPAPNAAPNPPAAAPAPKPVEAVIVPGPYPNIRQVLHKNGAALLEAIKTGKTPEEIAVMIVAAMPEQLDDEMLAFANDKEAADIMYRCYDPLLPYVDWLKKFVAAVRAEYVPENVA